MGGRPAPTCRPGRGTRRIAFVTGARSARRVVGWATSARMGAPTTRSAPWNKRSRRARSAGTRISGGLVHYCDHGSKRLPRRLHPTTRPRGDPGHPPEPWDPPTRAPPPKPRASPPASAGSAVARRPLEGTRRPRRPRPPDGWTGATAPAPTPPTTTASHPRPPNTATITTTPPHHHTTV